MARICLAYALKNIGYQSRFVQWLVLALADRRKALADWNSLNCLAEAELQKIVPGTSDSACGQELTNAEELHGVAP
jgi:hypothetical protein